jgi:RNA polymerase sigma-70 factor (ECF subfamily)
MRAWQRTYGAWPPGWVPEEEFLAYAAERGATDPVCSDRDLASLYLTCACLRGIPAAIRAFETDYIPEVRRAGERVRLSADGVSELTQSLRQKLLVGTAGERPKLAEYGGRGDLRGWLRVTAMRAALKMIKQRGPRITQDSGVLERRPSGDDPELGYMKALYADALRRAFNAAVGTLEPRDRQLLRQHFVEERTIDELGILYEVHRATVARWIQSARERLLAATRREFARVARLRPRECDSVLRLVQSRFDVTVRRLLA